MKVQTLRSSRLIGTLSCAFLMLTSGAIARAADLLVPSQYPTIQAGIDAAQTGDSVLVADGTYTGAGNKDLTFRGKAITVRSASDHPTQCVIDCEGNGRGFLFNTSETSASVLQGITVQNGNVGTGYGGGILCDNTSPTLTNCTFTNNNSAIYGGGMYNNGGSPTLANCAFNNNNSAGYGGGMYTQGGSPTLTNCTFTNNRADYRYGYGGGMYNYGGSPPLTNCTFTNNSAGYGGGGMYTVLGQPSLANCTFTNNRTTNSGGGGGMHSLGSSPALTNCAFTNNSARYGGGMYNYSNSLTLANCIFWANNAPNGAELYNIASTPVVRNNLIAGLPATPDADGNFGADPRFVRNPGTNGANDFGDLRLQSGSPAIDKGDDAALPPGVTTDLDGHPRIHGAHVDLGAYEFNLAPSANAGNTQNLTIPHDGDPNTNTASVTLDGSASSDPENDALTFAWDDGQGHTSNAVSPAFNLTAGTYNFTLTVQDTYGASNQSSVQIIVNPEPNQTPSANGQNRSLDQDTSKAITLTGTDGEGDPLTYEVVDNPTHGRLTGTAPHLTYVPDANYAGTDSFTFIVTDSYGAVSVKATITLTVNDTAAPVITLNGSDPMTVNQGSVFTDPGATALDNKDGNVGVSVSGVVNTAVPGSYTLTYAAQDAAGNQASKTRTVLVSSALVIEQVTVKRSNGSAQVKFVIRNTRTTTATDVRITGATLGGTPSNPVLPLLLGNLPGGGSVNVTITFKVGTGIQTLALSGSSSFGVFSLTQSVSVP